MNENVFIHCYLHCCVCHLMYVACRKWRRPMHACYSSLISTALRPQTPPPPSYSCTLSDMNNSKNACFQSLGNFLQKAATNLKVRFGVRRPRAKGHRLQSLCGTRLHRSDSWHGVHVNPCTLKMFESYEKRRECGGEWRGSGSPTSLPRGTVAHVNSSADSLTFT